MPNLEDPERLVACVAAELAKIKRDCLRLQDNDAACDLSNIDAAELKRRQTIDLMTQEIDGLRSCLSRYQESGRLDDAIGAPMTETQRRRIKSRPGETEPGPGDTSGQTELF